MSTYPPPPEQPPSGDQPSQGGQPPAYGQPPQGGQPPAYGQPPQGGQPPAYGGTPSYGQPPAYGAGTPGWGPPPPSNLVWGILTTIFCCLPLGIVSIVFASQVSSKWAAGDSDGAYASARKAKTWAIWSAVAGLVVGLGYAIWFLVIAGSADWDFTTY